jgi:hypothetical protein
MDRNTAEVAFHALGRIFWGVVICVLDFNLTMTTNSEGFKFDVISDVIGAILIARGIGQLRPLVFDPHYAGTMDFCSIVAMIAVLDAIVDHFVLRWPMPMRVAHSMWDIVSLYAVYRFCGAMRTFCFSASLFDTEATWMTSERLVMWLVLVPAVIIQVFGLMASGAPPRELAHLSLLVVAAVIAAAVGLIHVLLSLTRTRTVLRETSLGRFLP